MAKLTVKKYPDKILQQKSHEVDDILSKKIQHLIKDMRETMVAHKGIGLAAPQVGKNIRLFIVNTKDGYLTWINPKILSSSFKKEVSEEGCLSIPDFFCDIKRSVRIKVSAYNEFGKKITFRALGLYARVIQHEIDHLDGILIIDRKDEYKK